MTKKLDWNSATNGLLFKSVLILGSPLYVITAILLALGIAAVAFKNGDSRFKTTSAKPDPTEGRGTPNKVLLINYRIFIAVHLLVSSKNLNFNGLD
jgi:hypothetical protein